MTYTIRPYTEDDTDAVLSAWENASKVGHPFLSDDFIAQERINMVELFLPNGETYVISTEDGSVIGFLSMADNEVGAIFVQPAYHGTGAGRALMDKARSLHDILDVEVFEANMIGRKFYEKCGFVQVKSYFHDETQQQMLRLRLDMQETSTHTD